MIVESTSVLKLKLGENFRESVESRLQGGVRGLIDSASIGLGIDESALAMQRR